MEKLEHTVFQISELIGKERFGTLSEEENEVLEEWRRQSAEHETLYQKLQDTRYLSESVARLSRYSLAFVLIKVKVLVELKVSHEKGFNIPEKEPNKLFRNSVRSLYALSRRGFTKASALITMSLHASILYFKVPSSL